MLTSGKKIARPEQESAIQAMMAEAKSMGGSGAALQASWIGTGKTYMGTRVILGLWARRTLIAAPWSTYDGWRDTLLQESDGTEVLRPVATRSIGERGQEGYVPVKEASQNLEDLLAGKPGHYFVGREHFTTLDWETVTIMRKRAGKMVEVKDRQRKGVWEKKPFDVAIYDESHMVANRDNNGFHSWSSLKADLKIGSSATWFGNKWDNAWGAVRALWKDTSIVPKGYGDWKKRDCETVYDHFMFDKLRVVGEANPGKLVNSLPCYVQVMPNRGDPPVPEIRYVDLLPKQRKAYDQIEQDMVAWVNDNPLVVELPIVMRIRLRQLSLGMFSMREISKPGAEGEEAKVSQEVYFEDDCESSKFEELQKIAAENEGQKILVLTESTRFAKVVAAKLNKGKDKPVAGLWVGQQHHSTGERERNKREFIEGDLRFFIGQYAAVGTGTDGLQSVCHVGIQVSESESGIDNQQGIGRLDRDGQQHPVALYTIHARNTYDSGDYSKRMAQALANNKSRKKEITNGSVQGW